MFAIVYALADFVFNEYRKCARGKKRTSPVFFTLYDLNMTTKVVLV